MPPRIYTGNHFGIDPRKLERLSSARDSGCWLWVGRLDRDGYGRVTGRKNGKSYNFLAHQVTYELHAGPVPTGRELDHLCRVRHCVNPAHLEPVTHAENMRRCPAGSRKGRARGVPQPSSKTHCPKGHPYSEDNTYRRPSRPTHRHCRACMRAASAAWKAKNRPSRRGQRSPMAAAS